MRAFPTQSPLCKRRDTAVSREGRVWVSVALLWDPETQGPGQARHGTKAGQVWEDCLEEGLSQPHARKVGCGMLQSRGARRDAKVGSVAGKGRAGRWVGAGAVPGLGDWTWRGRKSKDWNWPGPQKSKEGRQRRGP